MVKICIEKTVKINNLCTILLFYLQVQVPLSPSTYHTNPLPLPTLIDFPSISSAAQFPQLPTPKSSLAASLLSLSLSLQRRPASRRWGGRRGSWRRCASSPRVSFSSPRPFSAPPPAPGPSPPPSWPTSSPSPPHGAPPSGPPSSEASSCSSKLPVRKRIKIPPFFLLPLLAPNFRNW